MLAYLKAPLAKRGLVLRKRRKRCAFDFPHSVNESRQRPGRRNFWIELTNGTRSRVSGIGKKLLPFLSLVFVELLELCDGKNHFAPNLDPPRRRFRIQPERQRANGADVLSDLFTHLPVPARRCGDQNPILVSEVDRHAVELQFGVVLERFSFRKLEELSHPFIKFQKFFFS